MALGNPVAMARRNRLYGVVTHVRRMKEIALGASLAVLVGIPPMLEFARPGTILCPLRRAGEALGIPMEKVIPSFLYRISKDDRERAAKDDAKWKNAALEKFPNLRITQHPLPPEENGFWLLHRLDKAAPQPTAELRDILGTWDNLDEAKARTALAANEDWVKRIESIAAVPGRSSTDLPDGPVDFFSVLPTKQAFETMLLQSVLAARSKDEPEALRAMKAAGNLIDHLHRVETPTLLTETACILCHQLRLKTIFQQVLPAIGPVADLDAWEREMKRTEISTSQLAMTLRGEWHVGCDRMTYPMLALAHRERRLIDPEAVAMAYADIISSQVGMLETTKLEDVPRALSAYGTPGGLTHEGRDYFELMHSGLSSWVKGYLETARIDACHRAAMDLLQIEPCQGDLAADDANHITMDPLTGNPFDFHPDTRTLRLPENATGVDSEVKLPWKSGY